MFLSLWRRVWSGNPVPSTAKCRQTGQHSNRPWLEPLEDRLLPATWVGAGFGLVPSTFSDPALVASPTISRTVVGSTPIQVSVTENSPPTVINLGTAFSGVSGLQHADGLKYSILGNTNIGLVRPSLSESALTLTYAAGKSGTATITVCATDADGVSVKRTVQVTVYPLIATSPAPARPIPTSPPVTMGPGITPS